MSTPGLPHLPHQAGVPIRRPMHPGEFLARHYLVPLSLSQSETARRLGISRRRVHELVTGQRAMSPDTAVRCALAFGLPAPTWLALQAGWDSFHAWRQYRQMCRQACRTSAARRSAAPHLALHP